LKKKEKHRGLLTRYKKYKMARRGIAGEIKSLRHYRRGRGALRGGMKKSLNKSYG